jgi:2-desacetyl-2-hydroxyethyl bacteriochlorophyllide A dehydrogenase
MKALMINQFGGTEQFQLQETGLPMPGRGEVLVRVHAAGINPVDYKIRSGSMRFIAGKKFPRILGQDVAGVVEQAGDRSAFRPGDKVYAMLTYKGGAYAEFVVVPEKQLCRIPEPLSMPEAAATPLTALTALQALLKGERIHSGDRILVNGASGGVGHFAVQIAKAMGAHVTAVTSTANLSFVESLGADRVIDYTAEDFTKTDLRYHKVFDAVAKSSFGRCKKILEKNGLYVSTIPNHGLFFHQALNFTRSKKAAFLVTKPSGGDLQIISDFIAKGKVRPHLERTYTISQIADAHHRMESGRVRGKIVLNILP